MKFVLLGGDQSLLPLISAIEANPSHKVIAAASLTDEFAAEMLNMSPSVRRTESWEELLNADFDAVIADGSESHETGIKQLAGISKPLLLVPFSDPASAFVYELTLVRDDTHGVMVPAFVSRCLPVFESLRTALAAGRWGRVLNLQWTRSVHSDKALLPRSAMHHTLLHDADTLRFLGGDYRQVTAVLSAPSPQELAMATVTLAGDGLPTSVWTIRPVTENVGWELVITTEQGTFTLRGDLPAGSIPSGNKSHWMLTSSGLDIAGIETADVDGADSLLRRFEAAVQGANVSPTWGDLQRATEIVEAVERSVRRRRTIDLHFETTSERNQFKTQMTAIGCGLMSMTFVSVLFLLAAGALFKPHPVIMKIAQVGIVVPLILFLLLQLLLFIARPSSTEAKSDSDSTDENAAPD